MKRLLLTGAAGFLGRTIAHIFSKRGWDVYGIDQLTIDSVPLIDLKKYIVLGLPNPRFTELLHAWKPEVCIHAAGRASVPQSMQDPYSDFQDGPTLTFELLRAIHQNLPKCAFILLSSAAVYGNPACLPVSEDAPLQPVSAYGYHKWQSEIICAEFANVFGLRTASARIFSAYGPGLRRQVMWDIVYKALTQPEVRLQGTGQESRDFIHARDIAHGLEAISMNAPLRGETYNLASGTETRIADLAGLILRHIKNPPPLVFSGELPLGTPKNWRADLERINKLGFQPQVALGDGISNFVDWCRNEIQGV